MRTMSWIGFACVLCLLAGATTGTGEVLPTNAVVKEVPLSRDPAEIQFVAGRLLVIFRPASRVPGPGEHAVVVLDRDGRQVFARAPGEDVPGSRVAGVYAAALDENGVLAISMYLVDTEGRAATALLEYDVAQGRLLRTVRTSPVSCLSVAVDRGLVWCLGYDQARVKARSTDYDVVYCFDMSGELLHSYFPRADFSRSPQERGGGGVPSQLFAAHGELAAWLPASEALLRWRSDGSGRQQLRLTSRAPEGAGGRDEIAMLADGRVMEMVYVGTEPGPPTRSLRAPFIIDNAGQLSRLPGWGEIPGGYFLAGADGEDLVFFRPLTHSVVWLAPSRASTQETPSTPTARP